MPWYMNSTMACNKQKLQCMSVCFKKVHSGWHVPDFFFWCHDASVFWFASVFATVVSVECALYTSVLFTLSCLIVI